MNLHAIARAAITAIHPDEQVTIHRSLGQDVDDEGRVIPLYEEALAMAQVQSLSDEKLYHSGLAGQSETNRTFYLRAEANPLLKPYGVLRPLARGGDIIKRADGTSWLVNTVKEDFSDVGWVNVGATLQVKGPDDPPAQDPGQDDPEQGEDGGCQC